MNEKKACLSSKSRSDSAASNNSELGVELAFESVHKKNNIKSISEMFKDKFAVPPVNQQNSRKNSRNMQHTYDLEKHLRLSHDQSHEEQDLFMKRFSTRSYHPKKNSISLPSPALYHSDKVISKSLFNGAIAEADESAEIYRAKAAKRLSQSAIRETDKPASGKPLFDMEEETVDETYNKKTVINKQVNPLELLGVDKIRAINSARNSLKKISITNQKAASFRSSRTTLSNNTDAVEPESICQYYINNFLIKFNFFVMSPDDNNMFIWLIILNVCVLYNGWLIIARQSFENLQLFFTNYWQIGDALSDSIYLLDILVQFRTGYLEQGLLVYDSKKLALNYLKSKKFLFDVFSMAPFELLQWHLGYAVPMLRFPRFFKCYRTMELYLLTESRTLYPNVWRVANLTHILFLLGHWFAGFYFLISKAEGFKGHWSYPEPIDEFALLPRMYLRCLYWSTLTLTTIGDLPPPETNWQYLFSIFVHYLAVFVIALIVGQVGNVITNRNASRVEFERLLDGAKQYMRNHNVPADMQKRVQRWYDYSWSRGRMNGSGDIHSIGLLPDKLKTELALHVNLETLRKVTIFHECQPEFLHDLVLKMRAYIFTPGDMICRKGEVAREMFIIADGVLEVIGDKGQVFTKMYSGDFFGEIGILNIEGASNRRTADVRSVGYSELFSLSKEDVLSAVKDYPDAEVILIEYGRRRLNQNQKARSEDSINNTKESEQMKPIYTNKCLKPTGLNNASNPSTVKSNNNEFLNKKNLLESINRNYIKENIDDILNKLDNPDETNINLIKKFMIELKKNSKSDDLSPSMEEITVV